MIAFAAWRHWSHRARPGAAGPVLVALLLLAFGGGCRREATPATRTTRLLDQLHAPAAPVPGSTARYPRIAIADEYRMVLASATAPPQAASVVEHARVPIDATPGAVLRASLGIGALAPDAPAVVFQVVRIADGHAATVLERSVRDALAWTEVEAALPPGPAELVFASYGQGVGTGAWYGDVRIVAPAPVRERARPNLLLISLDTLRADHLGVYGYERDTSPNMQRLFGDEGVVVATVVGPATNTIDGHIGMLEGLLPVVGRLESDSIRVWHAESTISIADALRGAGYRTAAFTENAMLDGPAGFYRGFDTYFELKNREGADKRGMPRALGHIERTFGRGIEWMRANDDRPFFLFLHTYQVHTPYAAPPAFAHLFPTPDDASTARRDIDEYDREIVYTDAEVGRLLDRMKADGLLDNTVVVVTADHGEEFGEHGYRFHGPTLASEVLHVPLLLRADSLLPRGLRADGPVGLIDLAPTLLDLLGVAVPAGMQGVSQLPHLRGQADARPALLFSEANSPWAHTYAGLDESWQPPSLSVTDWPWRLVRRHGPSWSLYNLQTDPAERDDLWARYSGDARIAALRERLDSYLVDGRRLQAEREATVTGALGARPAVEPEREEKLRELGYIE
jgi:arylsulfatase A-like enzyme